MPSYTMDQLDDLEEQSESTPPHYQTLALALVSGLLEANAISYGVMGGMNFYLRGSGRATGDIDIAVDNQPRMDNLLNIFNNNPAIWRPASRMQWASGVARLFVNVQGRLAQVDLKPKGAEGHLIPSDLSAAVETLEIASGARCKFLSIGPLVAAKIKAHYGRETRDDYVDLMFVCRSSNYAPLVRRAAGSFRPEWKACFLERVIETDPRYETQVRWALGMDRSPSPEDKGSRSGSDGGRGSGSRGSGGGSSRHGGSASGSRGSGGGSHSSSGGSSRHSGSASGGSGSGSGSRGGSGGSSGGSAPRDGDKSKDGYWTFSAKYNKWYHRSGDGTYKWA
ncbi:hypothetical protein KVR01_011855 [Diaporthe batatas]|uniref:uncharacterized protein n=1 Tax=Diaporthe batatas TaxID=748121 RepID=UPI001D038DE0|nr:uncharacterized protein KVR01_011855 [Diaporthe batatas]KAG8158094.1 hypothetical protein KVR01_011855 [Diaporthe batatas]